MAYKFTGKRLSRAPHSPPDELAELEAQQHLYKILAQELTHNKIRALKAS